MFPLTIFTPFPMFIPSPEDPNGTEGSDHDHPSSAHHFSCRRRSWTGDSSHSTTTITAPAVAKRTPRAVTGMCKPRSIITLVPFSTKITNKQRITRVRSPIDHQNGMPPRLFSSGDRNTQTFQRHCSFGSHSATKGNRHDNSHYFVKPT